MPVKARDAGGDLRNAALIRMRDTGNVLRTASVIRMRDGGNVLRTIFSAMSASASPEGVSDTQGSSSSAPMSMATGKATVTVTGGVAPFTYAWANSTGTSDIVPVTPTASATQFSALVDQGEQKEDTMTCTVTDAAGSTAAASVVARLHHVALNYGWDIPEQVEP